MQKKKKRRKKRKWDSVSWGFYLICYIVVVAPVVYIIWQFKSPIAAPGQTFAVGLFLALIVAGVITWGVNAILQYRAAKRREAERLKMKNK